MAQTLIQLTDADRLHIAVGLVIQKLVTEKDDDLIPGSPTFWAQIPRIAGEIREPESFVMQFFRNIVPTVIEKRWPGDGETSKLPDMVGMQIVLSPAHELRIAKKLIVHKLVRDEKIPNQEEFQAQLPKKAEAIGTRPELLEAFIREIMVTVIGLRIFRQTMRLAGAAA